MKLTNILPDSRVTSLFLGRDEELDVILHEKFADKKVIRMIQTHSDNVVFFGKNEMEQIPEGVAFLDEVDGVFTDQKNVVLIVKVADCYPILLFHPSGILGVVHAGRVGTEKQIVKKALDMILSETDQKEGWQLWMGPKICKDCYQVNKETDEHYDLKAKNIQQIETALDGENNFALDSELCTHHHNDWFYSYRKEGEGVKMNYGLVCINN